MRLAVTRPLEDARALKAALEAQGHEVLLAPVMEIVAQPRPLDLTGVQALLATSANGVRALAASTSERKVRIFCVGPATAAAARAAGFAAIETAGGGDSVALAALVRDTCAPGAGRLLHAAGTVSAGDLKGALEAEGFTVERQVLYEARAAAVLAPEAAAALRNQTLDGILFFSPRTVRIFEGLVGAEGLTATLTPLTAYCLSEAVGAAARTLPFANVAIGAQPTEEALLALVASP